MNELTWPVADTNELGRVLEHHIWFENGHETVPPPRYESLRKSTLQRFGSAMAMLLVQIS